MEDALKILLDGINPSETAILIGNGINQFVFGERKDCENCQDKIVCDSYYDKGKTADFIDWGKLLKRACGKKRVEWDFLKDGEHSRVNYPEVANYLELCLAEKQEMVSNAKLRESICKELIALKPQIEHQRIVQFARQHEIPIITTNFDKLLSTGLIRNRLQFGDPSCFNSNIHYMWNQFYTDETRIVTQENYRQQMHKFGIWHIHGVASHSTSIKFSLTDYMNCVARVKEMLGGTKKKKSTKKLLFQNKPDEWVGRNTLFDLFFHRKLIIIGLGLKSQETFLRWLFVQRARYLRSPNVQVSLKDPTAWFVGTKNSIPKDWLLQACGVEFIGVERYCDIYKSFTCEGNHNLLNRKSTKKA